MKFGIWIQNGDWIGGEDKRIIGKGARKYKRYQVGHGAAVYI